VPKRGEVWQVDFGITQKVRPALVITIPYGDADRALIGVVPHTTATRGSQFEVPVATAFLSEGAFLVQGIQALPPRYFLRRLGILTPQQVTSVERALLYWVGMGTNEPGTWRSQRGVRRQDALFVFRSPLSPQGKLYRFSVLEFPTGQQGAAPRGRAVPSP
jgi:mRNA interferase MazF